MQSTEQVIVQIMNSQCSLSKSFIVSLAAILSFTSSGCNPSNPTQTEEQKDIQSNAKTTIGTSNRAQQAHRLSSTTFLSSIEELGLMSETEHYTYEVRPIDPATAVQVVATPKVEGLKSYMGIVSVTSGASAAIVCESEQPTQVAPPSVTAPSEGVLSCPDGFVEAEA